MKSLQRGHRFPPEIISHAVWLYHRFTLSFRDVEDLLAKRGVTFSYEAIRLWCRKFGRTFARNLRRQHGRLGNAWHVDAVFITIRGQLVGRCHHTSVEGLAPGGSSGAPRYARMESAG